MLSDIQVRDLAKRMNIPLVFCSYKDNLAKETLQYGKSYVVNMESTVDPETGKGLMRYVWEQLDEIQQSDPGNMI